MSFKDSTSLKTKRCPRHSGTPSKLRVTGQGQDTAIISSSSKRFKHSTPYRSSEKSGKVVTTLDLQHQRKGIETLTKTVDRLRVEGIKQKASIHRTRNHTETPRVEGVGVEGVEGFAKNSKRHKKQEKKGVEDHQRVAPYFLKKPNNQKKESTNTIKHIKNKKKCCYIFLFFPYVYIYFRVKISRPNIQINPGSRVLNKSFQNAKSEATKKLPGSRVFNSFKRVDTYKKKIGVIVNYYQKMNRKKEKNNQQLSFDEIFVFQQKKKRVPTFSNAANSFDNHFGILNQENLFSQTFFSKELQLVAQN